MKKQRRFIALVIFGFCSIIINAISLIWNLIRCLKNSAENPIALFIVIGSCVCIIGVIYLLYIMIKENKK